MGPDTPVSLTTAARPWGPSNKTRDRDRMRPSENTAGTQRGWDRSNAHVWPQAGKGFTCSRRGRGHPVLSKNISPFALDMDLLRENLTCKNRTGVKRELRKQRWSLLVASQACLSLRDDQQLQKTVLETNAEENRGGPILLSGPSQLPLWLMVTCKAVRHMAAASTPVEPVLGLGGSPGVYVFSAPPGEC